MRRLWTLLAAFVALLLVVQTAGAHAAPAKDRTVLTFHAELSAGTDDVYTRTVGESPTQQYGTLRLTGKTTIDGKPHTVDVVVGLQYADGSGPWSGFMTLTAKDGSILSMSYDGSTVMTPGAGSTITGRMKVIGGTGRYAKVVGTGVTHAYRADRPGALTEYDSRITLQPGTPPLPGKGAFPKVPAGTTDSITADLMGQTPDQHFTSLPNGITYGIGRLMADSTDIDHTTGAYAAKVANVELLADLEYLKGDGPFTGFINLTAEDGSVIGMRYWGAARLHQDGSTTVRGAVEVIASSGEFAGMQGEGRVRGSRTGKVGAPLLTTITLTLQQAR
jgi:hypothetical protein